MQDNWSAMLREDLEKLSGALDTVGPSSAGEFREGERRRVAVLFLDMTGFTSMSEKMDHETVHQLVSSVMGALARVVELHQGYVDKFEGDRIMALFGAMVAAENDSIRAVSCGLRMLDTIEEINRITGARGINIGVRIGIDSGIATVAPDPSGHLTATGNCVNIASRLEETAPVGAIQATGTVRNSCPEYFTWEEVGECVVRGISTPVAVWKPLAALEHLPGTKGSAELTESPLVGRDGELQWLIDMWRRQVTSGELNRRGGAVHLVAGIRGDTGMGKTRLVHEFLEQLNSEPDDTVILRGSTLSFAQPPFEVWSSMFRSFLQMKQGGKDAAGLLRKRVDDLVSDNPDSQVSQSLIRSLPFLVDVMSMSRSENPDRITDEKTLSNEMNQAVRNLIRAVAEKHGRLVVVLEDLHWIDEASARALEFILCHCDTGIPVQFVGTFRRFEEETLSFSTLHEGLVHFEEKELEPLSEENCADLVNNSTGGTVPVPAKICRFLAKRSEGNPFYIQELLSALLDTGILTLEESEWKVSGDLDGIHLPGSITGLIHSRIDLMPAPLRHALQRASVLGTDFSKKLFVKFSGEIDPGEDPAEALVELEKRRILRSEEEGTSRKYSFCHVLVRDSVYDTLLRHNRAIMHRKAAESLETLYPDDLDVLSGMLSCHWEMSGDMDRSVSYARCALNRASSLYQHAEAIEWSIKVEELLERMPVGPRQDKEMLEILEHRRTAYRLRGQREIEIDLIDRMMEMALRTDAREWTGKLTCRLGSIFRLTNRASDSRECYTKALEIAREIGSPAGESLALDSLGALCRFEGKLPEALDYFSEALEINRRSGDLDSIGSSLNHMAIIFRRLGILDKAIETGQQAYEAFVQSGNRMEQATVLSTQGITAFNMGDVEEALRCYETALELARETGHRWAEGGIIGNLGIFYKSQNRIEEALECYREAMEIARETGDMTREGACFNNLGNIKREQGRLEEALDCFQQGLEIAQITGDRQQEALTRGNIGSIYRNLDEVAAALEFYRDALRIAIDIGIRPIESALYSYIGMCLMEQGSVEESLESYQRAHEIVMDLKQPLSRDMKDMGRLRQGLIQKGIPESDVPWPDFWDPPSTQDSESGEDQV